MKRFLAIFALLCFIVYASACESNAANSDAQTEKTPVAEEKVNSYKIGDEITLTKNNGEYKLIVTGVEETSERNQFAEKKPDRVIVISYSYENVSLPDELYIGSTNFKAYDKENYLMDTYPVVLSEYPGSISAGRKTSAKMAYGLDSEKNYVELEFYDNMFMDSDCKIILEW
ncbi:MAG: hypothetical protein IKW59_03785 [Clostridia bacterium]|nr:hypothetical protein [Clostridia bacterium]